MRSELRCVARRLRITHEPDSDCRTRTGPGGVTVELMLCGVGPEMAAATTARAIASVAPDHVVVVGIAGGLVGQPIGTVIRPADVIDHRTGRRFQASRLGSAEPAGAIVTTDGWVDDSELDQHRRDGVQAVDMESAAVAAAAVAADLPWSAIRAISDRPADGVVDRRISALVRRDGSADLVAVVRYLAPAPWRVARLAQLGRDSNTAARAASDAVATAIGW